MSIKQPRKVLFFSQDGKLGDAVVNTAFVAALKQARPDCAIHATVAGATTPFWAADTRIGKLWPVQRPGWLDTIRTGLAMRRERYDYIVTWQRLRKEKNKLLLWLAKPGKVIDLRAFNAGPLHHKIDASGAVLAQMGVEAVAPLAYAIGMPAACAELDALLPPGQEVIVLNLFAADAERNIGPAQAEEMLRGLRALAPQARLCLLCTNATLAAAQAAAVASDSGAEAINCDGNLPRLLRLCQRADMLISPDTAPIHIASAYDRPVVGIFQNNGVKSVQWGPRSHRSACVLSASKDGLAGFAVADVLRAVAQLRA